MSVAIYRVTSSNPTPYRVYLNGELYDSHGDLMPSEVDFRGGVRGKYLAAYRRWQADPRRHIGPAYWLGLLYGLFAGWVMCR